MINPTPNIVIARRDGEFRVSPGIITLMMAHNYTRPEAIARAESLAYYTDDREDAQAAANQMQSVISDWFASPAATRAPDGPFGRA